MTLLNETPRDVVSPQQGVSAQPPRAAGPDFTPRGPAQPFDVIECGGCAPAVLARPSATMRDFDDLVRTLPTNELERLMESAR